MRNAPSVLIPVGRSRFGVYAFAALWLTGLAVALAWWVQVPDPAAWAGLSGAQAVMVALMAACGLLGWASQRRTASGLLDWNGETWCWTTAQGECGTQVGVVCDLQRWMLVRLNPADGSGVQWLWLAPSGGDAHWRAARRALYCQGVLQSSPERPTAPP